MRVRPSGRHYGEIAGNRLDFRGGPPRFSIFRSWRKQVILMGGTKHRGSLKGISMTIDLEPELEAELAALAQRSGRTPEQCILHILRRQLTQRVPLREPRDEWERRLRSIATDCGVSLSHEALSREAMYD